MTDDFETSMGKLAASIATKASEEDTTLIEAIDAIKALTPYLALQLKKNGRKGDDADGETSFADFAKEINGTEDMSNGKAVRSRSRRAAVRAAS